MHFDDPMRSSPGGQLLWHLLRSRILGAGALRPLSAAVITSRAS